MSVDWLASIVELTDDPTIVGVIQSALSGDPLAVQAALDLAQENSWDMHPFEVGKAYYFETNTLYHVGLVVRVTPCWIFLERASWVHRTGRKSVAMRHKSFDKKHFANSELKPRTEYVGDWRIAIGAVTGFKDWSIDGLPMESIQ